MYLWQRVLFLRSKAKRVLRAFPLYRGRYNAASAATKFMETSAPNKSGGAEKMRVKITLACSECKQRNYDTKKNKKNDPDRLEMNKYCRFCRKHTLHKETK